MKIGIITVYDSPNYGSFLQAYALMEYLKGIGHEASFIKWNQKNPIFNVILKRAIWTKKLSLSGIKAACNKIKYYKQDMNYFSTISDYTDMDLIIVGSDTLWDIKRVYFSNPLFYGKSKTNIPQISYAVSCADSKESDFLKRLDLSEGIKLFESIMVRDRHTQNVIKNVFDIESQVVCDPTLLYNKKYWNDSLEYDVSNSIIIYAYSLPNNIIDYTKRFAKDNGMELVSIGLYHKWCNKHINCSALEFPTYLGRAGLVVTNTFHGTIFSILSKSRVICIENGNKVKELIASVGAEQIFLNREMPYKVFCSFARQKIEYQKIYNNINDIREKSDEQLRKILSVYSCEICGE